MMDDECHTIALEVVDNHTLRVNEPAPQSVVKHNIEKNCELENK